MLTLTAILEALHADGELVHLVPRSRSLDSSLFLPTLEPGNHRQPSPQLQERFDYAAAWCGPDSLRFFSPDEMESVWDPASDLAAMVREVRTAWEQPAISRSRARDNQICLVAASSDSQVFAIWQGAAEPFVAAYLGASEREFLDLRSFMLEFL